MNEEELNRKRVLIIASYAMIPFILGIPPIVGWYTGSWLDEYFHTTPYIRHLLLVLGVVAGIREVYRIIKKYKDEEI